MNRKAYISRMKRHAQRQRRRGRAKVKEKKKKVATKHALFGIHDLCVLITTLAAPMMGFDANKR